MRNSKGFWRALLFLLIIAALCGSFAVPLGATVDAAPRMQQQVVNHLVISQVYGGGGNANAPYTNDFVEVFNPTDTAWTLDTFSVQYASAAGTDLFSDNVVALSGTIQPGQFYLVQLASNGAIGNPLPASNATGNINLGASNGKVILVNTTAGLACNDSASCATAGVNTNIVDLVGYGSANYSEGPTAPVASNTTAVMRKGNGCIDTDNNGQDFSETAPTPRNLAFTPVTSCSAQFTATASAVNLTGTAANLTATASAANLTGTASAVNLTNTAVALTNVPAGNVVISEFRTRGSSSSNSASDEFIELHNPTNAPIDISGWKINGSNDSGGVETRATIPASTLLRSGQYYLIANNNYSISTVPADLYYGSAIADNGGIALVKADNTPVDQVGMSSGSAYKEGTTLTPMTGNSDQSYERKPGGSSGNCQDTNNNGNDFTGISPSKPQNYFSAFNLCGKSQSTPVSTTTTIIGHSPNPSVVNKGVTITVSVTVPFGSTTPTGIVNITGASTNCSITLVAASAGQGSCTAFFSTTGTKTLVATYLGDNLHLKSTSPAVSHQVNLTSATPFRTPTRIVTAAPPPELVAINEFVPRPGHDWNSDGVVNVGDEYIELLNHGTVNVNLSGWSIDDEVNIGSDPYRLPALTLRPGERYVFYGTETGLLLSDGGDAVRLSKPNGQLMDAYNYTVAEYPDQSFCRLPDNGGADDWNKHCYPTPGLQNSLNPQVSAPETTGDTELYCPIADTLPDDFAQAECEPFGNEIWNQEYWDQTGWYNGKVLPGMNTKWPVFAN